MQRMRQKNGTFKAGSKQMWAVDEKQTEKVYLENLAD